MSLKDTDFYLNATNITTYNYKTKKNDVLYANVPTFNLDLPFTNDMKLSANLSIVSKIYKGY